MILCPSHVSGRKQGCKGADVANVSVRTVAIIN